MDNITYEIQRAVDKLGLSVREIRLLSDQKGRGVFDHALRTFVVGGDRRWWWEALSLPEISIKIDSGEAYKHIENIVPDKNEKIWWIVEDDSMPYYPVYETTSEVAQKVIGECYTFEYYLIAKDDSWLLCENHHNCLIGIGKTVREALKKKNAEQVNHRTPLREVDDG